MPSNFACILKQTETQFSQIRNDESEIAWEAKGTEVNTRPETRDVRTLCPNECETGEVT